jgi:hypothetical protein
VTRLLTRRHYGCQGSNRGRQKLYQAAKNYIKEICADVQVTNLDLEEVEHIPPTGNGAITLAFSRWVQVSDYKQEYQTG